MMKSAENNVMEDSTMHHSTTFDKSSTYKTMTVEAACDIAFFISHWFSLEGNLKRSDAHPSM